jgi:hypothetical protein
MRAVINRIRLKEPIDDEVFAAAQRELPDRVAGIGGICGFHLVRCANDELIVVIFGESEESLDQMRAEIGNEWMRANVVPHAASPPDRIVGEVVMSYQRA